MLLLLHCFRCNVQTRLAFTLAPLLLFCFFQDSPILCLLMCNPLLLQVELLERICIPVEKKELVYFFECLVTEMIFIRLLAF